MEKSVIFASELPVITFRFETQLESLSQHDRIFLFDISTFYGLWGWGVEKLRCWQRWVGLSLWLEVQRERGERAPAPGPRLWLVQLRLRSGDGLFWLEDGTMDILRRFQIKPGIRYFDTHHFTKYRPDREQRTGHNLSVCIGLCGPPCCHLSR